MMAMAMAWKGTVILAVAFAAAALLRHRSAALRHGMWTAAFGALLLLPPWLAITPAWMPAAPVPDAAITRLIVSGGTRPAPAAPIPWLAVAYAAGCALAAARFAIGAARTAWICRRASAAPELAVEFGVRVVTAPAAPVPLAWGLLRPVVVLPREAGAWPKERLRSVLLHERMHLRRRDLLTQAMAQAAACLYWFHPLAWLALGRLRDERERACDDAVIAGGVAAPEYAAHLMEVVRSMAGRRAWADAPAMAESSNLEARVRALLDRGRDRRPLSRWAAAVVAAAALVVLAPLGALKVHAQAAGAVLAGVVKDPSDAVIPGCRVTAKNQNGSNQETAVANPAGEYRFISIPSGHYTLEFSARGFKLAKAEADVAAGAAARVDMHLALGDVSEAVTVRGTRGTPAAATGAGAGQRIRVGGMVQVMKLIRQPRPDYPADLQQAGVEGTVLIRAIISKDGSVLNPQVVNTVDPRLAAAALNAVSSWAYEPTLLNGEPVETVTTISIEFQLGQ